MSELRKEVVRRCCAYYNYQWPIQLTSGIMFFEGYKITIEEFAKEAILFSAVNDKIKGLTAK